MISTEPSQVVCSITQAHPLHNKFIVQIEPLGIGYLTADQESKFRSIQAKSNNDQANSQQIPLDKHAPLLMEIWFESEDQPLFFRKLIFSQLA